MAHGREDRGSPNNSDIRRRFMREFEEEIAGGREKMESMPIAVEIGAPDIGREGAIIDGDRLPLSCCAGHNAVARLFENSFLARYQTIRCIVPFSLLVCSFFIVEG